MILAAAAASVSISGISAECQIPLAIASLQGGDAVPEATADALVSRLMTAATAAGVSSDNARFYIGGKFNHTNHGTLAGPPVQHTVSTMLTLYVGDIQTEAIYATESFDLKGVGSSESKALSNALRPISGSNPRLTAFIETAKEKVTDYFDANAPRIFSEADKAFRTGDFEKALSLAVSIPECAKSYDKSLGLVDKYYQAYADEAGRRLYEAARASWASVPEAAGALEAFRLLMQIPVGSSWTPKADELAKEMKDKVADDHYFEYRTKYADEQDLSRRKLDAARQVGVAYGNGQQPTTTNVNLIK